MSQESSKQEKSALEKIREHWLFQLPEKEVNDIITRLDKFIGMVRGKVDIKSRLMLLANPENIKTSTILTPGQVQFVAIAHYDAKEFSIFEPLKDFAVEFAETNISKQGIGREQQIRFVGALQESKMLQKLGIVAEKGKDVKE